MFEALLKLLPKIKAATAALPEFVDLIEQAKLVVSDEEAETLEAAYAEARDGSDEAHDRLQKLVDEKTS